MNKKEWKYPSKGQLPKEMEVVLLSIKVEKGVCPALGLLGDNNKGWFVKVPFLGCAPIAEPFAWMELPKPPKEAKNEEETYARTMGGQKGVAKNRKVRQRNRTANEKSRKESR